MNNFLIARWVSYTVLFLLCVSMGLLSFLFGSRITSIGVLDKDLLLQVIIGAGLFVTLLFFSWVLALMLLIRDLQRKNRAITLYVQDLRAYIVPRIDDIENRMGTLGVSDAPEPPQKEVPISDADDKPLSTRERNTLLTIIAALCKDAGYDTKKHAKTAGLIQGTAASMGLSIGESTIEGHLKKIPDALESRMK